MISPQNCLVRTVRGKPRNSSTFQGLKNNFRRQRQAYALSSMPARNTIARPCLKQRTALLCAKLLYCSASVPDLSCYAPCLGFVLPLYYSTSLAGSLALTSHVCSLVGISKTNVIPVNSSLLPILLTYELVPQISQGQVAYYCCRGVAVS